MAKKFLSLDGLQYFLGKLRGKDISYDNSDSGMTATNIQGAIDEVNSNLSTEVFDSETTGIEGVCVIKTGNHVTARYNTYKKLYSQSGIVLGTLPENLRPVVYASGALVGRSGAYSNSVAVLIIEESGSIYIYGGNTDEARNWDGSVSYVI